MINETSLARSATLGDTSWDRLTIELASWNLSDSQLCLESKTDPSVAKAQKKFIWAGHRTKKDKMRGGTPYILSCLGEQLGWGKTYTGRGGHRTYFVDGGTIRVGAPN